MQPQITITEPKFESQFENTMTVSPTLQATSSNVGGASGTNSTAASSKDADGNKTEDLVFPVQDVKHFVGGFHVDVTEDMIRQHFEKFGAVQEVKIMRDSLTGRSRGFGFVTMAEPSSKPRIAAEKEHIIGGRRASVRPYAEQTELKDSFTEGPILRRKIFVGGVNPALGPDVLENYFSKYGPLEDAQIMRYPDGRSRGFGFVVFRDETACQQVLSQRNHHVTPRDRVEVKPCLSRGKARPASTAYGPAPGYGMPPGMYDGYGAGYGGYGNSYGYGGGYGYGGPPGPWGQQEYQQGSEAAAPWGAAGQGYDSYGYYGWGGYGSSTAAGPYGSTAAGPVPRTATPSTSAPPSGGATGAPTAAVGRDGVYYDSAARMTGTMTSGAAPYGASPSNTTAAAAAMRRGVTSAPPSGPTTVSPPGAQMGAGMVPPAYTPVRRVGAAPVGYGGGMGRGRPGPY